MSHGVKLSLLREAQCDCAASSPGRTPAPCRAASDTHHQGVLNNNIQVPFSKGPKKKGKKEKNYLEGKGTLKEFSALVGEKKIYFLCIILFCIRELGNE